MTDEDPHPKCKGCQKTIDLDCVQAVNADWHPSCFRCSRCQTQLFAWYIERAGKLLCRKDYWAKYRHLCNGCSVVISGPVMVAGEHRYHPECFQCCLCHGCIGQDEPYVLVERSSLFCGHCYHSHEISRSHADGETIFSLQSSCPPSSASPPVTLTITTPMTNTAPARTKPRRVPQTIHMVKLPPSTKENHHHHRAEPKQQENQPLQHPESNNAQQKEDGSNALEEKQQNDQCGLCLSILRLGTNTDSVNSFHEANNRHNFMLEGGRMGPATRIAKLDKTKTDLQDLEVGDCILEINGSSMRDKRLEEICDIICNRSASLNIVVERDPNPLPVPMREPEPIRSPTSPTSPQSEQSKEGNTIMIENTPVRMRNKASLRARGHSPNRRRSKSPSPCPSTRHKIIDLSRSRSFTSQNFDHRVFRPNDLIPGAVLGQGFFGIAIQAKHKVTGEYMVLKELHNFDEGAQKGFLTEVSMLRNLSHPCVLKFLGVLYRDKKLTLVTEFIDGGTLSDLLLNETVELSWIQRLKLITDIANGMSYLHSMDIIHRDLNSGNCFVRKDQSVVVGDFGLAKIFPRHSISQLFPRVEEERRDSKGGKLSRMKPKSRKKRQTVVGNPYWMAPEMIVSKGVYDEKVDIFSYGVIVFETIARVTADPDYLPRSLDFGVNVEAFHKHFGQQAPEPYTMLAMLCSLIEPDQRPSFDEIEVLCESLHLHLEHGSSVPQELKGSTVELYRATKTRLYGIDYQDFDSVKEGDERKRVEQSEKPVPNHQQESDRNSVTDNNNCALKSTSSVVTNESLDVSDTQSVFDSPLPVSDSPILNSPRVCHSDSSSVISSHLHQTNDPENNALNKSFPAATNLKTSSNHRNSSASVCDVTGEDSTYFSCSSSSSLSPLASLSSIPPQNEGSVSCKPSSNPCCCSDVSSLDSNNSNNSQRKDLIPSITSCSCSNIITVDQSQQQQQHQPGEFQHRPTTKENSSTNLYFHSTETETETLHLQSVQSSQSYFIHLDHCVHSDTTETSEPGNIGSDSDCPDNPNNQNENLSLKNDSTSSSYSDHIKPDDVQIQPSPLSSENHSRPTHLDIVDSEKSKLVLTLDRCHSPVLDSYMCSSRSRKKKARNSMNLDQASPNLSPQPKTSLDWNISANNSSA